MMRIAQSLAIVSVLVTGPSSVLQAQNDRKDDTSVAGKWTLNVQGSPHGPTTMGMALQQEGKVVSGTFASPHGEIPVKGEFADRKLTLATVVTGDQPEITFKAQLKDDGTLSGYLSSSMGDMTWTATRQKEK